MDRYHYWLVAESSGKPYLIYGGVTEDQARMRGLELLAGTDFQIKRLPTKNLARASSLLKGSRLEQTHSIKQASQRLGHEKSFKRTKRKYKNQGGVSWE